MFVDPNFKAAPQGETLGPFMNANPGMAQPLTPAAQQPPLQSQPGTEGLAQGPPGSQPQNPLFQSADQPQPAYNPGEPPIEQQPSTPEIFQENQQ